MTDDEHDTLAHLVEGAWGLPSPDCPGCTETFTRREHLIHALVIAGATSVVAIETVSATESTHPGWDMNELLTSGEWNAR